MSFLNNNTFPLGRHSTILWGDWHDDQLALIQSIRVGFDKNYENYIKY
jgi:hypothetical protein